MMILGVIFCALFCSKLVLSQPYYFAYEVPGDQRNKPPTTTRSNTGGLFDTSAFRFVTPSQLSIPSGDPSNPSITRFERYELPDGVRTDNSLRAGQLGPGGAFTGLNSQAGLSFNQPASVPSFSGNFAPQNVPTNQLTPSSAGSLSPLNAQGGLSFNQGFGSQNQPGIPANFAPQNQPAFSGNFAAQPLTPTGGLGQPRRFASAGVIYAQDEPGLTSDARSSGLTNGQPGILTSQPNLQSVPQPKPQFQGVFQNRPQIPRVEIPPPDVSQPQSQPSFGPQNQPRSLDPAFFGFGSTSPQSQPIGGLQRQFQAQNQPATSQPSFRPQFQPAPQAQSRPAVAPQFQPQPAIQPQFQPAPTARPAFQAQPQFQPASQPRPAQGFSLVPITPNNRVNGLNDANNLLIQLYGLEANRSALTSISRPSNQPIYQPPSLPTENDLPLLRSFMQANNIRIHEHNPLYNLRTIQPSTQAPSTTTPAPSFGLSINQVVPFNASNPVHANALREQLLAQPHARQNPASRGNNLQFLRPTFTESPEIPPTTTFTPPTQALPNYYQPIISRTTQAPSRTIAVSGQYLGPQLPRRATPTVRPRQPETITTTKSYEAEDFNDPDIFSNEAYIGSYGAPFKYESLRLKPANQSTTPRSTSSAGSARSLQPQAQPAAPPQPRPQPQYSSPQRQPQPQYQPPRQPSYGDYSNNNNNENSLQANRSPNYQTPPQANQARNQYRNTQYSQYLNNQASRFNNRNTASTQLPRETTALQAAQPTTTASPIIYPINFYKHVDDLATPARQNPVSTTTTTSPAQTQPAGRFAGEPSRTENGNGRPVVISNARQPSVRSYLQANNYRSNVRVVAVRRNRPGNNAVIRLSDQPAGYRVLRTGNRVSSIQSSQGESIPTTVRPQATTYPPARVAVGKLPEDTDGDGIPGEAGKDYPTLLTIPKTSFSCANVPLNGYYADTETACQVVHLCQFGGTQDSFLCPNGTIFNQKKFSCQWWYEVDCANAPGYYELNDNLYRNEPIRLNNSGSESETSRNNRNNK